jgi:hypothetical protein
MEEGQPVDSDHHDSHASAEVGEKQLFNPGEDDRSQVQIHADSVADDVVTWEASEYINHQKSPRWYVLLTVATVLLAAVLWLLLGDIWSMIVIAVMYMAITVYARREPRTLRYSVSSSGISIGEKHFDYDQFKSFSIIEETGVPSVTLDPTQRFMPSVSIYFSPEDGQRIVEELAKSLPQEQKSMNAVDRAMMRIRF